MRVLLLRRLAFQRRADGLCRRDEGGIGDITGRARAAVAGIDQLDGAHRRAEADGGQLEQALGIAQLHIGQTKAVALQRPEGLFDAPAQTIQPDHFGGLLGGLGGQCGEQPPADRRGAGGRLILDRLDQSERELGGIGLDQAIAGAFDADPPGAQRDGRGPPAIAGSARRHVERIGRQHWTDGSLREQPPAILERAIWAARTSNSARSGRRANSA